MPASLPKRATALPQSPRPIQVLIQVAYVGVGATDIAQRTGKFMPKDDAPAHHKILGLELSGLVVGLGPGAEGLRVGDRVCALVYGGGYAEYATAPTQTVLKLPDSLTLAEGAAVPENYFTVWRNVFSSRFGNLLESPQEKTVLVHGGPAPCPGLLFTTQHPPPPPGPLKDWLEFSSRPLADQNSLWRLWCQLVWSKNCSKTSAPPPPPPPPSLLVTAEGSKARGQ